MNRDFAVLRELARRYAEAAADPRNRENESLHAAVNDLKMIRPVVLIDEIPWAEFTAEELRPVCEEPFLRDMELGMRRTLYQWEHFPADMIITPYIAVPKAVATTGNGLTVAGEVRPGASGEHVSSHSYTDQLPDEEALEKLRTPIITHDEAETARRVGRAREALGELLPVRATGPLLYCETADLLMQYRGMDNLLIDMIDRPEFIHMCMEKLTEIFLGTVRQYEALGLLDADLPSVHCTAAKNSCLPRYDANDPAPVRLDQTWGRGMAQVFSTVSKDMHGEFDIPYMKRAMEPYGLVYYGCCEPLHDKLELLEAIPRLRKISLSPWADVDAGAERIGKRYAAAVKAHPANVASPPDRETVTAEINRILQAVKRGGCSCDIVLKDISTVGNSPESLSRWENWVMELVRSF